MFCSLLQLRTRTSLLQSLTDELREKSRDFLGGTDSPQSAPDTPKSDGGSSGAGSRFIDTVRKALIARVRNTSMDTNLGSSTSSGQACKKPPSQQPQQPVIPETATPSVSILSTS